MADVLTQIQERQARAQEQELASAQSNLDWNTTFGRMPPDEVLRESRNMTALIANAVERKAALAAQTNAEAQRIYITDQKFKAWQQTQPLRDDLLKAQIRDEEASERARAATELLTTSRKELAARATEQTALAEWEMDQIESANIPEADKRAWINTVRGKYPSMSKDTVARHEALYSALNPSQEKILLAGEIVRAREEAKRKFAPSIEEKAREAEAVAAARARGSAVTDKTPEQIEAEAAARARGAAVVQKTPEQIEAEAAARARGASVTNKTPEQIEAEAAARARGSAVTNKTPTQIEAEAAARARGAAVSQKTPAQIEAEAAARARGSAVTNKTVEQIEAESEARARGTSAGKPDAGFKGTPEEARKHYGPTALLRETERGVWTATIKPAGTGKPETWESWGKELAAAVLAHGGEANVPQAVWAQFEERKKALTGAASPATAAAPAADIYGRARAAIASGAPREAVIERLKQKGGDPSKL